MKFSPLYITLLLMNFAEGTSALYANGDNSQTAISDCRARVSALAAIRARDLDSFTSVPAAYRERLREFIKKYEGQVRMAYDIELFADRVVKFLPLLKPEEAWAALSVDAREKVWAVIMSYLPHYQQAFETSEAYEAIEVESNHPRKKISRDDWNKLEPWQRAARAPISIFDPIDQTRLRLNSVHSTLDVKLMGEISDPVFSISQYFRTHLDGGTLEFSLDSTIHDLEASIKILLLFAEIMDLPLFDSTRPYLKEIWNATFHLHMSFPGFDHITPDESLWRLERLNFLWLLKLLHARPEEKASPVDKEGLMLMARYMSLNLIGIIKVYSSISPKPEYSRHGHFELRDHFSDFVTEMEEIVGWMQMGHDQFEVEIYRVADELTRRDPSILKRILATEQSHALRGLQKYFPEFIQRGRE